MKAAFYRFEDGLYHPQVPATGSWNRQHQNGVAVGGLLVRTIEETPSPSPMLTARVTIDIMRPVPFQPIETRSRVLREGPRMQVLESQIVAGGEVVAKAGAVRIRLAETPGEAESPLPYPMPEDIPAQPITSVLGAGHPMETQMVKGHPRQPGPGAYWTTFNADLVEGTELPGAARAAMAADIASAPSSVLSNREWTYANVDLSVYFTRRPQGEWVLIDCETVTEGNGLALVNSVLADRAGVFGRAHQTLFVAPVPART